MSKTGIVCTLGPATRDISLLSKMVSEGMRIIRLNFSHGTHAEYKKDFELIANLNKRCINKVKILADLEGHRIRIGKIQSGKTNLKEKQKLTIVNKPAIGNNKKISIDYRGNLTDIKKGLDIFVEDGNLHLKVLSSNEDEIITEVQMDYVLRTHKGVNIPKAKLSFPLMEEKDRNDMLFALEHGVDFIANSFVRNTADMRPLIEILKEKKNKKCKLVAKIEDPEGIRNVKKILGVVDGIMVARGDMGVSVPLWTVPIFQKAIIRECNRNKKFVITATQMLDSMIRNPVPTRAEVSDIANAIIDGTDFVMLSGESSVGGYPGEAVSMMWNIIKYTEKNMKKLCRGGGI